MSVLQKGVLLQDSVGGSEGGVNLAQIRGSRFELTLAVSSSPREEARKTHAVKGEVAHEYAVSQLAEQTPPTSARVRRAAVGES